MTGNPIPSKATHGTTELLLGVTSPRPYVGFWRKADTTIRVMGAKCQEPIAAHEVAGRHSEC